MVVKTILKSAGKTFRMLGATYILRSWWLGRIQFNLNATEKDCNPIACIFVYYQVFIDVSEVYGCHYEDKTCLNKHFSVRITKHFYSSFELWFSLILQPDLHKYTAKLHTTIWLVNDKTRLVFRQLFLYYKTKLLIGVLVALWIYFIMHK